MIISDISGNYNLIKIKCIDKNPWQILRNKKEREVTDKRSKTNKTYALKRNLKMEQS